MTPSSGSITSPVPEMMRECSRVGHRQQGLQPPQDPVRPPVLGQLHRGPRQVAPVLLELRLELGEQGEGVRGRAGEAGENRSW